MKRYTFLMGEIHYESRCGYMRNLGPATVTRDGWVYVCRTQAWLRPEEWKLSTGY